MSVAVGAASKFSGAVDKTSRIYVEGKVMNNKPFLTKIGGFDVELSMSGSIMLTRQRDQPGIVGGVGTLLSKDDVSACDFLRTAPRGRGTVLQLVVTG